MDKWWYNYGVVMEQGQRLFVQFARAKELRFLSHLDMMRLWERALRRAQLPLRYSQGYHPHPRLSLALPLAVGMTGEAEWLEVELRTPTSPDKVAEKLAPQLPVGVSLCQIMEAPSAGSSLAALVYGAEYEVRVRRPPPQEEVQRQVARFLAADHWLAEQERKGERRTVDLRGMVAQLELRDWAPEQAVLYLALQQQEGKSVRPELVLQSLGLGPAFLVHRKGLLLRQDERAVPKGV